MRRVYRKLFSEWREEIKRQLLALNFGYEGGMLPVIRNSNPITYVCVDEGKVLAWALVTAEYDADMGRLYAMFYTRSKNRRQGLGTRIARRIKRDHKDISVDPWDRAAATFFESVGLING